MVKYVVVLLVLMLASIGYSQVEADSTLFSVSQESFPPNDSGGRWLPTAIIVKSSSAYPQEIQTYTPAIFSDYGTYDVDTAWRMAD